MKKLIIPLFIMILLSFSVYSVSYFGVNMSTIWIDENYEYLTTYESRGWAYTYLGGCSQTLDRPYSYNSDYVHGYNGTMSGCASASTISLLQGFDYFLDNRIILGFNLYIGNTTATPSGTIASLLCDGTGNIFRITYQSSTNKLDVNSDLVGGVDCENQFNVTRDEEHEVLLDIDLDNLAYTLYVDGNTTNCALIYTGTNDGTKCINGLRMSTRVGDTGQTTDFYVDDIFLGSSQTAIDLVNVSQSFSGDFCETNADCRSGKCEYGICTLKIRGESCTESGQCLSGECVNGICSKSSIIQKMTATKNQMGGTDEASANFISLFFILGLPLLIIGWGRNKEAVLLGIGFFFALTFFFAIIQWLSIFILIGNVIGGLILLTLGFILSKGTE